ncbi:hypothetical protein [Lacticaseibacillus mingshuiensis]|uniref:hypothetical protein n=1 Tax=Lacticaseibacillus mingshuiensis TaxID=2799574 RepID=UPI001944E693|nr:hypothetical protein [Lacticaseibacillus mingshuiensis]
MAHLIYVVYHAQPEQTVRLIKAFHSPQRARDYQTMLQAAPFPGEAPTGYQVKVLQLDWIGCAGARLWSSS